MMKSTLRSGEIRSRASNPLAVTGGSAGGPRCCTSPTSGASGIQSVTFQYWPAGLGTWTTIGVPDTTGPSPYTAGWNTTTLPDGTVIYRYPATPDPTALNGYTGGTNALGTLEGSGSAGPGGVTGQIGGHNNQTGADGYIGSNGACLNGNSLP